MSFKIIVTVSPYLIKSDCFQDIAASGCILYRINGAHAGPALIEKMKRDIMKYDKKPGIILDLPGNKVRYRCGHPLRLREGREFWIKRKNVNDAVFFRNIKKGDTIFAQDSTISMEVIRVYKDKALFVSHSEGYLHKNKGLHKKRVTLGMEFVSGYDRALIKEAARSGINALGISYARTGEDIRAMQREFPSGYSPELFIKIETDLAIKNIGSITACGGNFIIDRGDLASEIGLEDIPRMHDRIISQVKARGKKIFLATQFLKNMVSNPIPSIAEVNDLAHVLKEGINGIQLSDETAVGRYALKCVELINRMRAKYAK